jgi:hypothetical protein
MMELFDFKHPVFDVVPDYSLATIKRKCE